MENFSLFFSGSCQQIISPFEPFCSHNGELQLQARSENPPAGIKILREDTCPTRRGKRKKVDYPTKSSLIGWVWVVCGRAQSHQGLSKAMQAALRLFFSFWSWITWEHRLYLVTCSPLFPHLAMKWALWRLRSLSVFRCENSSKSFKVFANGCCSDSTRLAMNNNKEAARVLKVHFSFVRRVETAAFSAWCWNGTPNTPSERETVFTELVLFNSGSLLFLLSLFRRDRTELIIFQRR